MTACPNVSFCEWRPITIYKTNRCQQSIPLKAAKIDEDRAKGALVRNKSNALAIESKPLSVFLMGR